MKDDLTLVKFPFDFTGYANKVFEETMFHHYPIDAFQKFF